jgi:hypothetical protein
MTAIRYNATRPLAYVQRRVRPARSLEQPLPKLAPMPEPKAPMTSPRSSRPCSAMSINPSSARPGLAEAFDQGQEQDLAGVMIAQQQARLNFQATSASPQQAGFAYQDIMNMPI